MKIGNLIKRVVKLGVNSAKKFSKGTFQTISRGVKAAAKNSSAALKKAAKLASQNKKLTAGLLLTTGAVTVGLVEKAALEGQRVKINGFFESKYDYKDTTTIVLSEKGKFPVGAKIYFESDDNFTTLPDIIKKFLTQGEYKNLGLDDEEIQNFTTTVLEILKDNRDQIVSNDDNSDVVTTIDSYNPTIVINGVEEQNNVQLFDLLSVCAKESNIYLRIKVDLGTSLLNAVGVSKEVDLNRVRGFGFLLFFFTVIVTYFSLEKLALVLKIIPNPNEKNEGANSYVPFFFMIIVSIIMGFAVKNFGETVGKELFPFFFYKIKNN